MPEAFKSYYGTWYYRGLVICCSWVNVANLTVAKPGIRMCRGGQKWRTMEFDFCIIPKEFIN